MIRTVSRRERARLLLATTCTLGPIALGGAAAVNAQEVDPAAVGISQQVEGPGRLMHCDDAVKSRKFQDIFFCGDRLFETPFTSQDGIGANVGDGKRFTRVPRADLKAPGQWATQGRVTGPNANSCINCHNRPDPDASGDSSSDNVRDPFLTGNPAKFIERNPTSTEGQGVLQRLAEEINEDLEKIAEAARTQAMSSGNAATMLLTSKGIDFGSITAAADGSVKVAVKGIDADLVPKFADKKGDVPTERAFVRGAFLNELGLDPVEIDGNRDVDADGVVNEVTISDVTATTLYMAAQQPPTEKRQLTQAVADLMRMGRPGQALAQRLRSRMATPEQTEAIQRGEMGFARIGCTDCHRPELSLRSRVFSEPSKNPNFREAKLPAGQDPVAVGLDPQRPISFDLGGKDENAPQDNVFNVNGQNFRVPNALVPMGDGATVRCFCDLRFHDMGSGLAEAIDSAMAEVKIARGNSTFITVPLWGVGSTPPYLHDGRAPTLTEAILLHGGEAQASRDAFAALQPAGKADIIEMLNGLVNVNMEGSAEEAREGAEGGGDDPDGSGDDDS